MAPEGHSDGDFHRAGLDGWFWNRLAVEAHAFHVEFDGLANQTLEFLTRGSRGDASWKIGHVG